MWKTVVTTVIALAATSAHAEKVSARVYGLTPESGYVEAVTADETCDPSQSILVDKRNDGISQDMLSKCDGSLIGWVDKVSNGKYLHDSNNGSFSLRVNKGGDRHEYIVIEMCDESREDELAQDPSHKAAQGFETILKLQDIIARKAPFKIKLFFNSFELSGKCIGDVTELP